MSNEYKELGNAAFKRGDYKEAIELYSKGLADSEIDTQLRTTLHSNRAIARIKIADWRAALTDCNEGLKLDPNHAKLLERRGIVRKEIEKQFIAQLQAQQKLSVGSPTAPSASVPPSSSQVMTSAPTASPTATVSPQSETATPSPSSEQPKSRFVRKEAVQLESNDHSSIVDLMQAVTKQGGRMTKEQEEQFKASLAKGQKVPEPPVQQIPAQVLSAAAANVETNMKPLTGVWASEGGSSLVERLKAKNQSEPPKAPEPIRIRDRTSRTTLLEPDLTLYEHQYHALDEDGSVESVVDSPNEASVLTYVLVVKNGCLLMINEADPSSSSSQEQSRPEVKQTYLPDEVDHDESEEEVKKIKNELLSRFADDSIEEKEANLARSCQPNPSASLDSFADGTWTAPYIHLENPDYLDSAIRSKLGSLCHVVLEGEDKTQVEAFGKVTPLRVVALEDFPSRAQVLTFRYSVLADVDVSTTLVDHDKAWEELAYHNRPKNANFAWVPMNLVTSSSGLKMSQYGSYLNVIDQIGNLDAKVRALNRLRCPNTSALKIAPQKPLRWMGAGARGFSSFTPVSNFNLTKITDPLRFAHHLIQLAVVVRPCTAARSLSPSVLLVRPKPASEHTRAAQLAATRNNTSFNAPEMLPWMLPTTHLERGESVHFASRRLARGAFGLTLDSGFGLVHVEGGLESPTDPASPTPQSTTSPSQSIGRGYRFTVATSYRAHGEKNESDPEIPSCLAQPHDLWKGVIDRNFIVQEANLGNVPEHRWFTLSELEELVEDDRLSKEQRVREDVLEHVIPLLYQASHVHVLENELFDKLEGIQPDDEPTVDQRAAAACIEQIDADYAWAPLGTGGIFSIDAIIASSTKRS